MFKFKALFCCYFLWICCSCYHLGIGNHFEPLGVGWKHYKMKNSSALGQATFYSLEKMSERIV